MTERGRGTRAGQGGDVARAGQHADATARTPHGGDVVVVFARDPEPGRVKTRLAASIGDASAAELYAAFVSDLRRTLADARCAVRWAVAPPDRGFAARFAVDPADVFAQEGADLGARMHDAFARMRRAGFARIAIVGSDMPQLRLATIDDAFRRLDDADLVLGPADDGGYYLIAAREALDVFEGIAWGGADVLAATLARAATHRLRTSLLDTDFDVDDVDDLARLEALLAAPEARNAMPATAAVIRVL